MAMSPFSTVSRGQHDGKYVTIEVLLHAAFVADEILGFILEPARFRKLTRQNYYSSNGQCVIGGGVMG